MTDIELPNLPRPSGWAPTLKGDIYVADKVREYATAAILADREKRAQAAQPDSALLQVEIAGLESSVGHLSALVDEQRRLLVEVEHVCGSDDYGVEFEDGDSELIDKVRAHLAATEASKPVQAEAPTASNAGERIDLSQWEKARFGYFDQAGRFVEFSGEDNELPNDSSPRWVGGLHDMQLLRAAFATQQEAQPQVEREPLTDEDQALDLLETLFDAYENGVPCHEDGDQDSTFIGHAFRLDDETFHTCADLLNRRRPRAHGIAAQHAAQAEPAGGDKEDAERYRWLRHGDNDERVLRHYRTTKLLGATMYLLRNDQLDAAIDAARAAQQATGDKS